MAELNNKAKYDIEYAKKNLKRIPLDVTKEKYQEIKTAASIANESVNGYIKKAIDQRMNKSQAAVMECDNLQQGENNEA